MNEDNDDTNVSEEGDGAAWWNRESVAGARSEFRRTLQKRRPDPEELWISWMHYFLVANVHGVTRHAAKCLAHLVERSAREHCQVEKALSRHARGAVTRMGFRALLALAEQPDTPAATVRRVAAQVDAFFIEDGCQSGDRAAARLAWTARLGLAPEAGDLATLLDAWAAHVSRRAEMENERETGAKGERENPGCFKALCAAAASQILAESLLRSQRQIEAFEVVAQALAENPCVAPCGLAPQGMLGAVLVPLHLSGRVELAADYESRLARVAPLSAAWLEPAAARVGYLDRCGRHGEALEICLQAAEFADQPETSAWHRRAFHRAAACCLGESDDPEIHAAAERHQEAAALLESAFAARNARDTQEEKAA